MLSPTPFSLLCALLLCLPLAIIFTITTPLTPSSIVSSGGATLSSTKTITLVRNRTKINSVHIPLSLSSTTPSGGSAVSSSPKTVTFTRNKTKINSIPTTLLTSPSTPSSSGSSTVSTTKAPTFTNKTKINSRPTLQSDIKTRQKPKHLTKPTTSPPPQSSPQRVPKRRAPPHLHELNDDDSLFQLAGRVNSNPKPPKRKLAFLFLTTTPLPFAPLWEAFFNHVPKNLYNIYIHADPSFNYSPPFHGVFSHRVIPSKHTQRNSPTLASAARRLLAHALLHDKSNYMFALFSAACIPLHSFNFTYKVLTQSKKSFIEILDDEPGAYERWAARGADVMLPEVKFEDFRIGSQFFVLKRKHARVVARDRRLWSKFNQPCVDLSMCYPEEHYFPTLLNTVDPHGCVHATLTHVDWSDSEGGHPRTYYPEEVSPELIWTLRSTRPRYGDDPFNVSDSSVTKRHDPLLFARKFSPDCLQPLMGIADDVMFKD